MAISLQSDMKQPKPFSTAVSYSQECQIAPPNIGDFGDDTIVVSKKLYNSIHGRVGCMTAVNTATETAMKVARVVCTGSIVGGNYSELDKMYDETQIHYVIVGKNIRDALGLGANARLKLINQILPHDQVVDASIHDASNAFGKSWRQCGYFATGILAGIKPDVIQGRNGLFLDVMQIANLMLNKTLRPLCGEARYTAAVKLNSKTIGVIRIFHNGNQLEADVYPKLSATSSSAIFVTETLSRQLGAIDLGDTLFLCSRFDTSSKKETLDQLQAPGLSTDNSYDAIALIEQFDRDFPSVKKANRALRKRLFDDSRHPVYTSDFIPQRKLAHFLESLTSQADRLASSPGTLARVLAFFESLDDHGIEDSLEFNEWLRAIKNHENMIQSHQNSYMNTLQQMFQNARKKGKNPLLMNVFFRLEIPVHDQKGNNLLHLLFLNKGSIEDLGLDSLDYENSDYFRELLVEFNNEGETPLHILCRIEEGSTLVLLEDVLSACKPEQFVHPLTGSPFHSILKSARDLTIQHLNLLQLLNIYGENCLNWFAANDQSGKVAFDYLDKKNAMRLCLLTVFVKVNSRYGNANLLLSQALYPILRENTTSMA